MAGELGSQDLKADSSALNHYVTDQTTLLFRTLHCVSHCTKNKIQLPSLVCEPILDVVLA